MDTTNYNIKEAARIDAEIERLKAAGKEPPEVIDSVRQLDLKKRQYLKLTNSERRHLKRLSPEQRRRWLMRKAGLSNG